MESDETVELHSTFKGHLEMVSNMEYVQNLTILRKEDLSLLPSTVIRGILRNYEDDGIHGVLIDSYVMETKLHGDLDPFWR